MGSSQVRIVLFHSLFPIHVSLLRELLAPALAADKVPVQGVTTRAIAFVVGIFHTTLQYPVSEYTG